MVIYYVVDSARKVLFETSDLKTARDFARVWLAEQGGGGTLRIQFEGAKGWRQITVGKQGKAGRARVSDRGAPAVLSPARRRATVFANAAAASLVLMVVLIAVKRVLAG